MNLYSDHHDYSLYLLDMSSTDPTFMESLYNPRSRRSIFYDGDYDDIFVNKAAAESASVSAASEGTNKNKRNSPPKHRHDGTSPLPFGMDWSPPPRLWVI